MKAPFGSTLPSLEYLQENAAGCVAAVEHWTTLLGFACKKQDMCHYKTLLMENLLKFEKTLQAFFAFENFPEYRAAMGNLIFGNKRPSTSDAVYLYIV